MIKIAVMLRPAIALVLWVVCVCGQQPSTTRTVFVSVTDPLNRFVTGLTRSHFGVTENGVARPISSFVGVDEPMRIVVVGSAIPDVSLEGLTVMRASSVAEAVRQLAAASTVRKGIVVLDNVDAPVLPGILSVRSDPAMLLKTIVQLANQYEIRFSSSDGSGPVSVTVDGRRSLPELKARVWR